MTKKPLTFEIHAAAWGYEITRYRGMERIGTCRRRWLWLAKYYVWAYKHRLRKMGEL